MLESSRRRVIRQTYIVEIARGQRVLDIGCVGADGALALHRRLSSVAAHCTGIDLTASEGVVVADAQSFELGESFDVIIAGEVIEHLGHPRGLLDSCGRHLPVGGRLIVTTPNPYSALSLARAVVGLEVPNEPSHVLLFDPTTLRNFFAQFGGSDFAGELFYYEEDRPGTLPYRLNKAISRFSPAHSIGIIADLRKVR